MSERDYGTLLEAVGWIEQHAGVDAPDYPHRDRLAEVVNNISKRRQSDFDVAHSPPGDRRDLSTLSGPTDWSSADERSAWAAAALPPGDDAPAA